MFQDMAPSKRQSVASSEPVLFSSAMKAIDRVVRAVAAKDVTLTLLGETGTGKEVLARRAHDLSGRRHGPFVPVNCAAIPEALFESELFGHERGAFTGATQRSKGKIEAAEHGTLFLDEIGEMPLAMQAKLLRFLENHRYTRVGGTTKIQADVRLVLATLRPLELEVRAGRFRADLFYRIQGIVVAVPPLRERRADIAPLLNRFVSELSARHEVRPPKLGRGARALLLRHDWPGNVRELRNLVETLCLLRSGRQVRSVDLPPSMRTLAIHADVAREQPSDVEPAAGASPRALLTLDLDAGLASLTQRIVEAALALEGGNTLRAAARLRISPRTIQRYVAAGRVGAAVVGAASAA
jgi:DNA-binding NtrC family response regulator